MPLAVGALETGIAPGGGNRANGVVDMSDAMNAKIAAQCVTEVFWPTGIPGRTDRPTHETMVFPGQAEARRYLAKLPAGAIGGIVKPK